MQQPTHSVLDQFSFIFSEIDDRFKNPKNNISALTFLELQKLNGPAWKNLVRALQRRGYFFIGNLKTERWIAETPIALVTA